MSQASLQISATQLINQLSRLDYPILLCFDDHWVAGFCPSTISTQPPGSLPVKESPDTTAATFQSGWAGIFNYPASRKTGQEESCTTQTDWFGYYPVTFRLDIKHNRVILQNPKQLNDSELTPWLNALTEIALTEIADSGLDSDIPPPAARQWQPRWSPSQYQAAFNRVQNYLKAGDCYQINLTMPFYCTDDLTDASPLPLLQAFTPRFGGYLKTAERTLFSVSPERFIRIDGNRIVTSPIKGTLPRGQSATEDQQLATELASSSKNQAENLMIVDLLRNDLSINAQPHSVKVEKLFELESHANVHHLVSTISAKRRDDKNNLDVVTDAFPGGSITGAPKQRAMEIIDELEAGPRGAYCGSMGYFDDDGHAEFNILIRTIEATADGAVCWGGGGITIDSTADDEYQEILNKVGKILQTPL